MITGEDPRTWVNYGCNLTFIGKGLLLLFGFNENIGAMLRLINIITIASTKTCCSRIWFRFARAAADRSYLLE